MIQIAAQSESEVTSLTQSLSPRSSPKRPFYYVQSPSNDDEKYLSSRATPGYSSPMSSPSHSSAFASSASRFSGSFNPWKMYRKRSGKGSPAGRNVIDEEGEYDDDDYTCRRLCLLVVLGLVTMFMLVCFILWGVSRPLQPQINIKHLRVNNYYVGEGTDNTGVLTKLMTLNCSLQLVIYNPASFFGIHVSSTPLRLLYYEITVATGQLKKYYQTRKSQRVTWVSMEGEKVPLYGAGASVPKSGTIPLRLEFEVLSRGNVVGNLVKTKHHTRISCSIVLNFSDPESNKIQKDVCTYK